MKFIYKFSICLIILFPTQHVKGVLKEYAIEESSAQCRLRQMRPFTKDTYDSIEKEALSTILQRVQQIEAVFLQDQEATEIKLTGNPDLLESDDMYPVARGMIARSCSSVHQKISRLDLTENDITETGFFTLYTAFVNRGICDQWGVCRETQQNNLIELTIDLRTNPIRVDSTMKESLQISSDKGITFLLDDYLSQPQ